jgi:hypothetical protein
LPREFAPHEKLANLLLNANSSNLEANLATADNEAATAILGVSVDKLKRIAPPAMELSAALAASSNTPDLSQATLDHTTKVSRKNITSFKATATSQESNANNHR